MPTYDYECRACGHRFEELQSFSEPPLTRCPACKKNKLERLFGGGGAIIFKGSGFYETDYRRAGEAKTNGTADADAGAAKTETKAETKSESSTPAAESSAPAAGTSSPAGGNGSAGKSGSKGGSKKGK